MTLPLPTQHPSPTADDVSRDPRPAIVTIAVWLQLVAVVIALAAIVAAWLGYIRYDSLISRAAELAPGTDPATIAAERGSNLFGVIAGTVLFGAVALGFGLTARPIRKGSNTARLLTLTGSGLLAGAVLVLCVCSGLGGFMMLPLLAGAEITPGDPYLPPGEDFPADSWSPEPFYNELWNLEASSMMWHGMAIGVSVPLLFLITVAVFVLLLITPSARWFSPASAVKIQHIYVPVYYPYPSAPHAPAAMPPPGYAPGRPWPPATTPNEDTGQPNS